MKTFDLIEKIETKLAAYGSGNMSRGIKRLLKDEGIFIFDNTYNRRLEIRCNEEGHVWAYLTTPGQQDLYKYWVIVNFNLVSKSEYAICDGAVMNVDIEDVSNHFGIPIHELQDEFGNVDCISWFDMNYYGCYDITAEDWVNELMCEEWDEWVDNYENRVLMNVHDRLKHETSQINGNLINWRDAILEDAKEEDVIEEELNEH